ncbi:MAG: multidrug MFS transporter, partial [Peptococcaceae bacterium]|nr:multidrug MFS transporter [Peptococcaceae bacterium]
WEYTRRISRALPCYVVNSSRVVHAMQNNKGSNIARDELNRLDRYAYAYRNEMYFYKREGIKGLIWLLAKDLWHSVQIVMHKKGIAKKLKIVWGSAWKGVSFQPEIEYCSIDE